MSSSYYTKHTLYLVGESIDEEYFLIINDNQYSSLVQAEGASLPTIPSYFNDGVVSLAAVYVQSGSANITQIEDIRPVIGFRAAGVNASAVHGNLLGLGADDHTQYLLVDGGRQLSGDLGLGGNDLYNFSIVSGSNLTVTNVTASVANITSITGSLLGSATSASYATTASFALSSNSTYTVSTKTSNYTETATQGTIILLGDTTGAGFTISLPPASGNTSTLVIKKIAGANSLIVNGDASETIDGGLTATINRIYESITLISDNSNWQII